MKLYFSSFNFWTIQLIIFLFLNHIIRRENKNAVINTVNKWFELNMKLSIHGCRGSTATSSSITKKYGGNTSCFEIRTDNHQFIFDAGSGFQNIEFSKNTVTYLQIGHCVFWKFYILETGSCIKNKLMIVSPNLKAGCITSVLFCNRWRRCCWAPTTVNRKFHI